MRPIRRKEVYRYLGYSKSKHEINEIKDIIEECIQDVEKVISPQVIYQRFPLEVNGNTINIQDLTIESKSLGINLKNCQEVYLFAATAGIGIDRLIKRAEITNMGKAVIYQAIGAEAVECICDELNDQLKERVHLEGLYLKPRFSPGYGDTSLELQKDFERLLNMSSIGISLTDSLLMVPSKSVTAFVGITSKHQQKINNNCETCTQKDCPSRRN